MKRSILKASKKLAEDLSKSALAMKTKKGNPIFKRVEIENGFELHAPMKDENGKWKPAREVVFRYLNENGRQSIEWNEEAITTI